MKKLYLKVTLVMLYLLFGRLSLDTLSAQPSSQDPNWISDALVNGVQCYHSIVDCNGKKVVFLKFDNKNSYKVEVSWKEVFKTQMEDKIEGFSGIKKMVLGLGETKETSCKDVAQKQLLVLPEQVNPTYVAEILKFDYKAITVTKIN